MSPEEFKLIMEAIKGVTDGAVTVGVIYMLGSFLVGPIKYSIVGIAAYKIVQVIVNNFEVVKEVDKK